VKVAIAYLITNLVWIFQLLKYI